MEVVYEIQNGRAVNIRFSPEGYKPTASEKIINCDALPDPLTLAPQSLDILKAEKNATINDARLMANASTFTHAGKVFKCDVLSRGDIETTASHIALFNEFPPAFPGGWKADDNTFLPMPTIEDFKAFYRSMSMQGTANFNRAQALKAQLAAADTADEINAVPAW